MARRPQLKTVLAAARRVNTSLTNLDRSLRNAQVAVSNLRDITRNNPTIAVSLGGRIGTVAGVWSGAGSDAER